MKKNKIITASIIVFIVAIFGAFLTYVSIYYHAQPFKYTDPISRAETKDYIVYGEATRDTALIFYPGGKVEPASYEPLMYSIASSGEACVFLMKMPFNLAVFKQNAADAIISKYPNISNYYIGGHSLGGAMAANYAAHSSNIKGLVLLAAYSTKDIPQSCPVLSIYGSNDHVLSMTKYKSNLSRLSNVTEHVIEGGNHSQFGNYGMQKGDGDATIDAREQWALTTTYIIDYIKATR